MPRQRAKRIGRGAGGDGPAVIGPHRASARAALVGLAFRLKLKQHAVAFVEFIERRLRERRRAKEHIVAARVGRNEPIAPVLDQRGNDALRERRLFGLRFGFQAFTYPNVTLRPNHKLILAFFAAGGKVPGTGEQTPTRSVSEADLAFPR